MDRSTKTACAAALILLGSPCFAAKNVSLKRDADLHGSVQINSVSGSMEVIGWDKPVIEVTGTLESDSDSVEVNGDPAHVSVQVRTARTVHFLGVGHEGARITVHVPAGSSVNTTLVSADFKTSAVTGDLELHTVSGDSKGEVGGNLRVNSVSGDVRIEAPASKNLVVKTISGDVEITGGSGETDISTVSGSGRVALGTQSRVHFKSTSGDMHLKLGLAPDAQLDGESISGDVVVQFNQLPAADFSIETHSGDIDNCFGPKPVEPGYGPGQKLAFKNGEGNARVHIVTHSGDVELCAAGAHRS